MTEKMTDAEIDEFIAIAVEYENPSCADVVAQLRAERDKARVENDKLRGLLAKGGGDCVHCGLPAADIAKCAYGFPGCGRMDDIMAAHVTAEVAKLENDVQALMLERDEARDKIASEVFLSAHEVVFLRTDLAELRKALTKCADQFAFYAAEHERAGKTEKAATNRAMEKIARDGLAERGYDPPAELKEGEP